MTWIEFKTELERNGVRDADAIVFIYIDRGADRVRVDWVHEHAFGVWWDYSKPIEEATR